MKYLAKHCLGLLFLLLFTAAGLERTSAAVTAASLAIIGYDDYQDSFTALALNHMNAGEVIYFTNNGWSSTQGKFNGADATQGAGNESLIKLTLTQSIEKGTVISSVVTGAAWEWTRSGLIPGQIDGFAEFGDLAIDYESDQIYAFQAGSDNPLLNPTNFIYALHFGSGDYPGFSDSEDSLTGDIPPGLTLGGKTAFAHTDLNFHGDADGAHSAWSLNLNAPEVQNLQLHGGSKTLWLNAIANSDNWSSGEMTANSLFVAPEPGRIGLLILGLGAALMRRHRLKLS